LIKNKNIVLTYTV